MNHYEPSSQSLIPYQGPVSQIPLEQPALVLATNDKAPKVTQVTPELIRRAAKVLLDVAQAE